MALHLNHLLQNQHSTAQHSTAQHSTAQHSTALTKILKFFSVPFLISTILISPTSFAQSQNTIPQIQLSQSDQHGCQAYLCFAGGLALPECQSTIRKVKRDLLRGKSFPSCSFISNKDGSMGGENNSPKIWTERSKKWVIVKMKDEQGKVSEISSIKRR